MRQADHARQARGTRRGRAARPEIEGLEARMLLYSVTGDHFAYGSRITWSIMPDGTNLDGASSNLVSSMNQKLGPNWVTALDDAFAQWESITNVNFAEVADDGAAFGSGPYQQGSPEFGDIRIGGVVQGNGILAFTILPPAANGGSDSGDVFFNTSVGWNIGSDVDLETVALHEIGHALGMGHSTSVQAVMYPYYGGVQHTLSTDDIAGVRSIWGPRQEDTTTDYYGNTVASSAADLTPFIAPSNGQVILPTQDVANPGEAYWFKITTPSGASNVFTAQVQTAGLSEMSPRVQVYNASLQGLVQTTAPANAYGTIIDATITNATPNTTYYIKVLGSNAGATGTGAYALEINTGSSVLGLAPPPNTQVPDYPDQGGGYDLMTDGGPGTWVKSLYLAFEASPALIGNPKVAAVVNDLLANLSAPKPNAQDIKADLVGLLQDLPPGFVDLVLATWEPGVPPKEAPADMLAELLASTEATPPVALPVTPAPDRS